MSPAKDYNTMPPPHRSRGPRSSRGRTSTSANRSYLGGLVLSIVLMVGGLASLVAGIVAWQMDQIPPVRLVAGEDAALGRSPWFRSGSTVFTVAQDTGPTKPSDWNCELTDEGATRRLTGVPDVNLVGTRVIDGQALVPVVTVGPSSAGSTISCDGSAAAPSGAMWVLPTDAGLPKVALAMVVGGFALLGGGALVHPRSRGLERFGQ